MNSVNLLPSGGEGGARRKLSVSPPFLGLVGGLGLALGGAVLYVSAHDTVRTRQHELAAVTAATSAWSSAAGDLSPTVQAVALRAQTVETVRSLAVDRYDWSVLLRQLAGRMPTDAGLTSVQASAPSAGAGSDGVQLLGCAASQDAVAATMVSLRRISGVSGVTLTSSAQGAGASGSCPLPVNYQISLTFATTTTTTSATSATTSSEVSGTEASDTEATR